MATKSYDMIKWVFLRVNDCVVYSNTVELPYIHVAFLYYGFCRRWIIQMCKSRLQQVPVCLYYIVPSLKNCSDCGWTIIPQSPMKRRVVVPCSLFLLLVRDRSLRWKMRNTMFSQLCIKVFEAPILKRDWIYTASFNYSVYENNTYYILVNATSFLNLCDSCDFTSEFMWFYFRVHVIIF